MSALFKYFFCLAQALVFCGLSPWVAKLWSNSRILDPRGRCWRGKATRTISVIQESGSLVYLKKYSRELSYTFKLGLHEEIVIIWVTWIHFHVQEFENNWALWHSMSSCWKHCDHKGMVSSNTHVCRVVTHVRWVGSHRYTTGSLNCWYKNGCILIVYAKLWPCHLNVAAEPILVRILNLCFLFLAGT